MTTVNSRNRRRGERFPADLVVCLYHGGRRVGSYRTRDVSQGGLALRAGRVMFWRDTQVELQLFAPASRRPIAQRLPAVVRYCSSRGMGLRLRGLRGLALPFPERIGRSS